jgi:hypothetical protein
MFTLNHVGAMGDLFVGLNLFLKRAPAHHLEALALVLREYDNQGGALGGPGDTTLAELLMEVGGMCADAAECANNDLGTYRGALRDQGRLAVAAEAVIYATAQDTTPQDISKAYRALVDLQKKAPAESKPAAKGPQAVKPAAKRARSRKRAA